MVPEGSATRPTTDRVREATFNSLFSMNAIDGATFIDLFAGSGALGLEAISRGAASVTFVERDRAAIKALQANIETLGFGEQSTVIATDSLRWLQNAPRADVLLADPPYDFEGWVELLGAASSDLLVAESNSPIDHCLNPTIDGANTASHWEVLRQRAYGSTVVTILQRLPKDDSQ